MLNYQTQIRVRYADTDKMGVVYYANYAVFYEVARTELFRSLGVPYSSLEQQGIALPVVELVSHYHRSAHYDDLLTIDVSVKNQPTAKIVFDYEIRNERGELLNDGQTTLVFVNMQTGRPVRMPDVVSQKLNSYF